MLSDSFPIEEIDDVILKVTTKMVVKDALNVNIGANPSQDTSTVPMVTRCPSIRLIAASKPPR